MYKNCANAAKLSQVFSDTDNFGHSKLDFWAHNTLKEPKMGLLSL